MKRYRALSTTNYVNARLVRLGHNLLFAYQLAADVTSAASVFAALEYSLQRLLGLEKSLAAETTAQFLFDVVVAGIGRDALRQHALELAQMVFALVADAIIVYAIDSALEPHSPSVYAALQFVPALSVSAWAIRQRLDEYATSALVLPATRADDTKAPIALPSLAGWQGDRVARNMNFVRLWLAAPLRAPMPWPSAICFPDLPREFAALQLPSEATAPADRVAGTERWHAARQTVAHHFGAAAALARPDSRRFLPLCMLSVLERVERRGTLHNEDRWWMANVVMDAGAFDVEDLGTLFAQMWQGGGQHFGIRQQTHVHAHAARHAGEVKRRVEQNYPPFVSVSCRTMATSASVAASERRAGACPLASQNYKESTVRTLLAYQQTNLTPAIVDEVVALAARGQTAEACLRHAQALKGDQALRTRSVAWPARFIHLQCQ